MFALLQVLDSREISGAPGGTRTPDLLVRSQTLYPTELRAHGTLFTINSLPQFLLRIQPRESLPPVIWERCFGQVIPLIRNGLIKKIFTFDCLAPWPDALSK
jgi:hypothetical protein